MANLGAIIGAALAGLARAAETAGQEMKSEEKRKVKTLQEAIDNISSASSTTVVGKLTTDGNSLCETGSTDTAMFMDGSHTHTIYGKTTDVPSMSTARCLVSDLKAVAEAAKSELADNRDKTDKKFQDVGAKMANVSGLLQSIHDLHETLATSIADEQSSHRRFEQLVQTLLAAQSEVKALYDTIDKAIEAATKTATSGALGQIEDKGREIAHAIENQYGELQRRIESAASRKASEICDAASAQFAQTILAKSEEIEKQARQQLAVAVEESAKCAKENLMRQTGDLLTSRQNEFAAACSKLEKDTIESAGTATNDLCEKLRETVKQEMSELAASTVAEMERKLAQLCQDAVAQAQKTVGEKIDEIVQAEIDTFSQSVSKVAEARAAELAERTTSAVQQLNVDLQAQIPALFRTTDAPSTFGARLKWLLLGKV